MCWSSRPNYRCSLSNHQMFCPQELICAQEQFCDYLHCMQRTKSYVSCCLLFFKIPCQDCFYLFSSWCHHSWQEGRAGYVIASEVFAFYEGTVNAPLIYQQQRLQFSPPPLSHTPSNITRSCLFLKLIITRITLSWINYML